MLSRFLTGSVFCCAAQKTETASMAATRILCFKSVSPKFESYVFNVTRIRNQSRDSALGSCYLETEYSIRVFGAIRGCVALLLQIYPWISVESPAAFVLLET